MPRRLSTKALARLIKQNPTAIFQLDNDWWGMYATQENGEDQLIATSRDMAYSLPYGQDILHALAEIVGVEIESV